MSESAAQNKPMGNQPDLKISDWLWTPLYAKIWWFAVLLYWSGFVGSFWVEATAEFYQSAAAGFANVVFFPPIVALILSFGFLRAWLASENFERDEYWEEYFERRRKRYGPSGMLREFDPLDPGSGVLWIGNPLNPASPAHINRHSS